MSIRLFLAISIVANLLGCNSEANRPKEVYLQSTGSPNDILVVCDQELQTATREAFKEHAIYPGLLSNESSLRLLITDKNRYTDDISKYHSQLHLINVSDTATLALYSRLLGEKNIAQLETNLQLTAITDVFAKDQIIYLQPYHNTLDIGKLITDLHFIWLEDSFKFLNKRDKKLRNPSPNLSTLSQENLEFDFKVPRGYRLEKETESLLWFRMIDNNLRNADFNLVVSKVPYTSTEQLTDSGLTKIRNKLTRNEIFANQERDSTSYMIVEERLPLVIQRLDWSQTYSLKSRGWWKINNVPMGGPFVTLASISPDNKWIYLVDGFIYAPGQKKVKLLRKLEAAMLGLTLLTK